MDVISQLAFSLIHVCSVHSSNSISPSCGQRMIERCIPCPREKSECIEHPSTQLTCDIGEISLDFVVWEGVIRIGVEPFFEDISGSL